MDGKSEVAGCLTPEPVPGHAPGMLSFRLRSRGEEGLFTADVMHNAIQIVRPDWNDRYCALARQGARIPRRRAQARGRARRADHADASRRALLRLRAPAGRRLRIRAGHMSEPVVRNSVKERLARGEVASSMTVRLTRSIEIAQLAKTAGFNSLYIDLEHSSLSLETTSQICVAALACGIAPFVRVPQLELIQRVLDGGALGIIVPDVRNAEQAREPCSAAKYPPLGERGFASALPHFQYRSLPATRAYPALNDATMVIVQFEMRRGDRPRRGDFRRRWRRHGAVRHQRSDRRHGHSGRLR